MNRPKIYADFHNADPQGRLRLNCIGTIEDLSHQKVELREGTVLTLYADDVDEDDQPAELQVDGVVSYSEEEHCWVAAIDWDAIRRVPGFQTPFDNGKHRSPRTKANEA